MAFLYKLNLLIFLPLKDTILGLLRSKFKFKNSKLQWVANIFLIVLFLTALVYAVHIINFNSVAFADVGDIDDDIHTDFTGMVIDDTYTLYLDDVDVRKLEKLGIKVSKLAWYDSSTLYWDSGYGFVPGWVYEDINMYDHFAASQKDGMFDSGSRKLGSVIYEVSLEPWYYGKCMHRGHYKGLLLDVVTFVGAQTFIVIPFLLFLAKYVFFPIS